MQENYFAKEYPKKIPKYCAKRIVHKTPHLLTSCLQQAMLILLVAKTTYYSCSSNFVAAWDVETLFPIRKSLIIAIASSQYTNIARMVVHSKTDPAICDFLKTAWKGRTNGYVTP